MRGQGRFLCPARIYAWMDLVDRHMCSWQDRMCAWPQEASECMAALRHGLKLRTEKVKGRECEGPPVVYQATARGEATAGFRDQGKGPFSIAHGQGSKQG